MISKQLNATKKFVLRLEKKMKLSNSKKSKTWFGGDGQNFQIDEIFNTVFWEVMICD